jgi:hypothetical protein
LAKAHGQSTDDYLDDLAKVRSTGATVTQ